MFHLLLKLRLAGPTFLLLLLLLLLFVLKLHLADPMLQLVLKIHLSVFGHRRRRPRREPSLTPFSAGWPR